VRKQTSGIKQETESKEHIVDEPL